jgi:hypothetical protein
MLRRITALAAGLLALSVPTLVSADGSSAAHRRPVDINLIKVDDRDGKGFDWSKRLPCGSNHAKVTITFKRAYPNESQMPVAKIWLHADKTHDTAEQWIAAAFSAPTDAYKLNSIEWLEKVEGSVSEGPGYAPADLKAPLHIDITWTDAGVVTVNFGDNIVKHVNTNSPITDIGMSVSWANFEFSDLKVDRLGSPDPACLTKPVPTDVVGHIMMPGSAKAPGR